MADLNTETGIYGEGLDKNSSDPLYIQISARIKAMIDSGALRPLDQIPPELELAEKFGVSRITVRQAIALLVEQNLLTRRQGVGTFVTDDKIARTLVNVSSFSEQLRARGFNVTSRTLSTCVEDMTEKLSSIFHMDSPEKVVRFDRIRHIDDVPVTIVHSYISSRFCPGIEKENLSDQSLYHLLEDRYGMHPGYSHKTIELVYATSEEAQLLEVAQGTPLFLMQAVNYSDDHRVMEYMKAVLLADRFRFQI